MSHALSKLLIVAAAAIVGAGGVSHLAIGQAQSQGEVFALADNDGIVVNKTTFKGFKGSGERADASAALVKMGAKEVSANAIIYRSGDKLYMVDGTLPRDAPPQYSHDLKEWCPTCSWYVPQTYMR